MKRTALITLILLGACDDDAQISEEPKTLCEQVSDKLYECVGARVPITYCSQETSRYILNASCEDVLEYIKGSQR